MMELDAEPIGDRGRLVRPRGRLDMVAAPSLRTLLKDVVSDGDKLVVVDLAETTFIDSSGLGAVVAGLKAAREVGADLRIARPSEQVDLVLELTTLNRVLHPYPSVEAAVDGV